MKVAILMWCVDQIDKHHGDRGAVGTIERISTTAKDCVEQLKLEMKAEFKEDFIASSNGSMCIIDRSFCNHPSEIVAENDFEKLKNAIQDELDNDHLGMFYIRASRPTERMEGDNSDYAWWKIMFRNLH